MTRMDDTYPVTLTQAEVEAYACANLQANLAAEGFTDNRDGTWTLVPPNEGELS